MKRLIAICAVVLLIVSLCSVSFASTIREEPDYRASSNLTLGSYDAAKGFQISQQFQLNLEYQCSIPKSTIDAFNNYLDSTNLNFADNDYYYLKINCTGGLPIGIWDFYSNPNVQYYAPDSGESWVEWTLSYYGGSYFQTILAGDILNCAGPDTFLRVQPTAGYRSFLGDGLANDVEVFDGATVNCEVIGYSSPVSCENIAEGTVLTPSLVPEPATICLLGLGVLGLLKKRRA